MDSTAPVAQKPTEPTNSETIPEKPRKRIAIFGTTPSRMEGPHSGKWHDGTEWERWTIGPGGKDTHEWERLFEVHGVWPKDFEGYLNDLSQVKKPKQIITIPQPGNAAATWQGAIQRWKRTHGLPDDCLKGDWEAQVTYPREEILARFPGRMWFSSSISWCIALAIAEGATDIGLWGIDLESGEEYVSQFAGCKHFLNLANFCGINTYLPEHCGLERDPAPYPDRNENVMALTLEKKVKWVNQILGNLEPQFEELTAEVHRQEGRLLMLRDISAKERSRLLEANPNATEEQKQELAKTLMVSDSDIQGLEQALMQNNRQRGHLARNINQLKGEQGSLQFMQRMFVWGHVDPESIPYQ